MDLSEVVNGTNADSKWKLKISNVFFFSFASVRPILRYNKSLQTRTHQEMR